PSYSCFRPAGRQLMVYATETTRHTSSIAGTSPWLATSSMPPAFACKSRGESTFFAEVQLLDGFGRLAREICCGRRRCLSDRPSYAIVLVAFFGLPTGAGCQLTQGDRT